LEERERPAPQGEEGGVRSIEGRDGRLPLAGRPNSRFLLILAIFVAVELGVLSIGWGAVDVIGTTRAYSTGESLYAKGQKSAVLDLHRYVETGDERQFAAYQADIAVPIGDRLAREALERSPRDEAAAASGFLAGGNARQDVPGLVTLFEWARGWGPFAAAVAVWHEADAQVARMDALAGELHGAVGRADWAAAVRLLDEIDTIDGELTRLERSFLDHVGTAARSAKRLLGEILGVGSALLMLGGSGIAWRTFRRGTAVEEAIRASEQRFRDFAESASDWFWETTPELELAYLSERFAQATGMEPASLIGCRIDGASLRGEDAAADTAYRHLLAMRKPFKGVRLVCADAEGKPQVWMLNGTPMRDRKGRFLGYRGIGTDVTAEIAAQQALAAAKAQAELASRSKSEFLAHVSHEFRTPLNAILGFSELIRDARFGPVSERYSSYADDIHNSGRHLLSLVNDILDLSKIEAGKGALEEESIDLPGFMEQVSRLMRERIGAAGLSGEFTVAPGLPTLLADRRRLIQMLINLLGNAVKFTPRGGEVAVTARLGEDGGIVLAVSDTGIGIAPENLAKVLAPFGQVDSPLARRHQGTGLGLSLTKAMAELHGARLELDSEPGRGTTVTILLPPERTEPVPSVSGESAAGLPLGPRVV
jgi:PAS domain S-box-containing protein